MTQEDNEGYLNNTNRVLPRETNIIAISEDRRPAKNKQKSQQSRYMHCTGKIQQSTISFHNPYNTKTVKQSKRYNKRCTGTSDHCAPDEFTLENK